MGREELVTDPAYATPEARLPHLDDVFGVVEQWTKNYTKFEVLENSTQSTFPAAPSLARRISSTTRL
jgi:formyl-CoA transferase